MAFVETEIDMHTIASLLKLYLRELPNPLIPFKAYEPIIKIVTRDMALDPDKSLEDLVELVQSFPEVSYNMLQYLCRFLHEISLHEETNKMSAMNLATCFVHSFIRPEEDDPALLMGTSNGRTQVTYILILQSEKIFSMEYTPQGGLVTVDAHVDFEDGSGDVGSSPPHKEFNPQALARHVDVAQQNVDDLFAMDDKRVSVRNLPEPINPQTAEDRKSNAAFESKLQKGLARTGSKRGAVIVDRESSSSEKEHHEDDIELPSPISDYYAMTPQSPPTADELASSPERTTMFPQQERTSILRETPQTQDKKPAPIPSPRPASKPTPSIPPRPQSMQIPTVPPRPRVRKTVSAQNISTNGSDSIPEQDTIVIEDNTRASVVDIDTSDFSLEQLRDHTKALCHELRAERVVNDNLRTKYEDSQQTHKKALQNMAAKLDAERNTLAQTVDKVVELQMKITGYEMNYGALD